MEILRRHTLYHNQRLGQYMQLFNLQIYYNVCIYDSVYTTGRNTSRLHSVRLMIPFVSRISCRPIKVLQISSVYHCTTTTCVYV
jgi:hypothetical protein